MLKMPKLKMFQFLAVIIVMTIITATIPLSVVWGAETSDNEKAELYIADSGGIVNKNLTVRGQSGITNIGGKNALWLDAKTTDYYMMFDIDDEFMYDLPMYTALEITIEYFDQGGNGFIALGYDSHRPSGTFGQGNDRWAAGETIDLKDTGEWKNYTWYIEDAMFKNRCDSHDFRLGKWTPGRHISTDNIIIRSVTVEKVAYRKPLDIGEERLHSDEHLGNIFESTDEINLALPIINKTDKEASAEYTFKVFDKDGKEIEAKQITDAYKPKEQKDTHVVFDQPGEYGIYDVEIDAKISCDGEFNEKYKGQFSVSRLMVGDMKNSSYGVCQQTVGSGYGDVDISPKIARNLGSSFWRDDCWWSNVEKQKGVLAFPDEVKDGYRKIKDSGLNLIVIMANWNNLYDNGNTPHSDEAIAAFANYCAFCATELKDITRYYEIWNEYNITQFNNTNEPPETYAKMLKAAYTAIKNANPDAIVIGIDTAGIDLPWIERVFEAGGYDYLDAVSVHPYDWSGMFKEQEFIDNGNKLKELMRKYGEEKPIYYTEAGFRRNNGVEAQCKNLVLMNAVVKAYDLCDALTQYCLYNAFSGDDFGWGMLNSWEDSTVPNGAIESYIAIGAMNYFWGSAEFKDKIVDDENRLYAFNSYNNYLDKDVLMLITGYGSSNKSFDLGCDTVNLYDMYGNLITTIKSDNGIFDFQLKEVPTYVVGNFKKFTEAEQETLVDVDSDTKQVAVGETVTYTFKNNSEKNFRIEIEENENFKILENSGFVSGQASITLEALSNKLGAYTTKVYFKDDGGNVYQMTSLQTEIISPIKIDIASESSVERGNTHWRVRAVLENLSSLELSGTLNLTEPLSVAELTDNKTFSKLKCGEKVTFLFNLPESVVQKPINITLKLRTDNGYETEVTHELEFGVCYYAEKKPTIDGVIDPGEWNGIWIGADEKKDVRENDNWKGPSDLSLSAVTMWDEEKFYFLAIVADDIFSVNYTPQGPDAMWRGDNVQFALDDRVNINIAERGSFFECGLAYVPGYGDTAYRFRTYYEHSKGIIENSELVVKRYDTYTVYEFAIPWSEIFYEGYKIDSDRTYRFSMLANENDVDRRNGWIEYKSGIAPIKNVELFGSFRFVK